LQLVGKDFDLAELIRLPRLTHLIMNYDTLPAVSCLLDPSLLPSLRHLALPMVYGDLDTELLRQSDLAKLLPQLESINVNWRLESPLFDNCADRTLFDCSRRDVVQFLALGIPRRHLRLVSLGLQNSSFVVQKLPLLADWIKAQGQGTIHSLYLDHSLRTIDDHSLEIFEVVDRLVKCCKEQKIGVVFERQAGVKGVDLAHSEEFCRRQSERMRGGQDRS